jgi:4-hydroxy-tetrahydrodipicolinate synthase
MTLESAIQSLSSQRLVTAMVTPFDAHENLDLEASVRLSRYLWGEQQSDTVLVAGTTGECPALLADEKRELLQAVAAVKPNGKFLWAYAGTNVTRSTVAHAEAVLACVKPDALLAIVPYYNKPTQAGLLAHFKALAHAVSETPVVLYNIPGRCITKLEPETMLALAQACPNIVGLKQSYADLEEFSRIRTLLPAERFLIWSGDDALTLPMLSLGAQGVVSVASHVAGPSIQELMTAFARGDHRKAQQLQSELLPLFQGLFVLPNPTLIKALLHDLRQIPSARLRLPLLPLAPDQQALLEPLHAVLQSVLKS